MHRYQLHEITRDVDIASAIQPLVTRRGLSYTEIVAALIALDVPRAAHIAALVTPPAPLQT